MKTRDHLRAMAGLPPTQPVILTCTQLCNLFAPAIERGDERLILHIEMTTEQRQDLRKVLDEIDAGYYDEDGQ